MASAHRSGVPRSEPVGGRPAPVRVLLRPGRQAGAAAAGRGGADTLLEWDDMLLVTDKVDANGKRMGALGHGEMWFHSDKCYHRQPHRASFLYAWRSHRRAGTRSFRARMRLTRNCRRM